MGSGTIVILALIALFALLAVGVPVSISLATAGTVGLITLSGFNVAGNVLGGTTYTAVGSSNLLVIPMFFLMGMLTLESGIAPTLFALAAKGLRWLPGGLGVASVFAAAGFGAVSGSSLASIATLGRTSITEMMRHGYSKNFAAAIIAVSGTLAILIPPSIILVVYGVMTGESVGALLLAGFIPGVLSAVILAAFVCFRAWRNPSLVMAGSAFEMAAAYRGQSAGVVGTADSTTDPLGVPYEGTPLGENLEMSEDGTDQVTTASAARAILGIIVLFSVVVGGLYTGIFTPTESASVGAFAAFILVCTQYLKSPRKLGEKLSHALQETASMTGMVFLIVVGAGIFSYFLVAAGVTTQFSTFVLSLDIPPLLTVGLLLLLLVPGGMFLDSMSLLVITAPLLYGPITALGFDGIWLGIVMVTLIELGMITPPVGINVFVTSATMPGLKSEKVFAAVFPFFIAEAVIIAVIFLFPALSTWLPNLTAL